MNLEIVLFVFFGLVALISILAIFITNDIMKAIFWFVAFSVSMSILYMLLNAHFMAVVQLLIYAGGIVVLLAFGIMFTSSNEKLRQNKHFFFFGIVIFLGFIQIVVYAVKDVDFNLLMDKDNNNELQVFGKLFMLDYLIAFESIAFLLLMVLVGAIYYGQIIKNK